MAKKSLIERDKKRRKMAARHQARRERLKAVATDRTATPEDRFQAHLKLAELPRNSARVRARNRCELTGRPRGYYRKFKMSRIALRVLANYGQIPGVVKSSW